jgi:hypothetical protein
MPATAATAWARAAPVSKTAATGYSSSLLASRPSDVTDLDLRDGEPCCGHR